MPDRAATIRMWVQMETCGQIACSVGRLPIRFTVGTGGTIRSFTVGTGGTIIEYPHPSVRATEARTSTLP